jgi:hypothetical protein
LSKGVRECESLEGIILASQEEEIVSLSCVEIAEYERELMRTPSAIIDTSS